MQIRTNDMCTTAQCDWGIHKVRSDKLNAGGALKRAMGRGADTVRTSPVAQVVAREISRFRSASSSGASADRLSALAARFGGDQAAVFSDQELDVVFERMLGV